MARSVNLRLEESDREHKVPSGSWTTVLDLKVLAGSILILAAAALPFVIATMRRNAGPHFWGAIWHPPDDSLLLSVIQEGMQGKWLHTPPYASVSGPAAFFYPSYLAVG